MTQPRLRARERQPALVPRRRRRRHRSSLAVGLPGGAGAQEKKFGADGMPQGWRDDPRIFVAIAPDGTVTVTCHRQEMGQGVRTSVAMVVADELDADWAKVRVAQAPGDEARYGNQDTDGSRSLRHFFMPLRRAGAAARTMLEQAAAQQWGVPISEVKATDHAVVHAATKRTLGYGALAAAAAALPVPARETLKLKDPASFRYIGNRQGGRAHRQPRHHDRQGDLRHRRARRRGCCTRSSRARRSSAAR